MSPILADSTDGIITSMWQEENNELIQEFSFPDFAAALAFANKIGELAAQQNHHPELVVSWGRVKVILSTHSEGKVTSKDRLLADAIDQLVANGR